MPTIKSNWHDIENYRNTSHTSTEDGHECTLYSTKIFSINYSEGRLTLRHDGHTTATTKRRMNECLRATDLPYKVRQESGVWYVYTHGQKYEFDGREITFNLANFTPVE